MATKKEQAAFELENPGGFVTQASEIGYNEQPLDETVDNIKDVTDRQKTKELDAYYICDSNGNAIAKFYAQGLQTTNVKAERFYNKDGNALAICDGNGNVVAEVDCTGLSTTNVKAGKFADIQSDTLNICDHNGNVVGTFNSDGLDLVGLRLLVNGNLVNILTLIEGGGGGGGGTGNAINEWEGKAIAFYGDSVTAICNGNFQSPYTSSQINSSWGNRVAAHLKFSKCYGRGIGGQRFSWHENSGSVSWLRPDGTFIGRNDNFSYDNFDNKSYPTGVTSEMELTGTAIRVRGCGCSWLRITKTFPADIKDTIHVVSIMYHNDAGAASTEAEWVANDVTDTEWAASEYYSTYGGDYNINTVRGGIASIIMKLQAWMPNAVLILCTPISGNGTANQRDMTLSSDRHMIRLADDVMAMSKRLHIPCIDVNRNDGINGINRISYIYDSIHPYTVNGKKMVARAIIGGLKTILPNFD